LNFLSIYIKNFNIFMEKNNIILFKYSFCSCLDTAVWNGRTVPHPTPIQATPYLGGFKNDTRYPQYCFCHTRRFVSSFCWHKTLVTYFVAVYFDSCNYILPHLLRSWVRIPPGVWISVCCVCCQVEVFATSWSLVQGSPTDRGASFCVIKKSRVTSRP
jgi:hypothetical protein